VSKKIRLFSVALVVFVVVLMAFASVASAAPGDHSNVVGTDHNVMVDENPCEGCHIPHGSSGDFLWAKDPNTGPGSSVITDDGGVGSSSAVKPLCYSCHDGTTTDKGQWTAFNPETASHRTKAATALKGKSVVVNYGADGVAGGTGANADTKRTLVDASGTIVTDPATPYGIGRDCDLCHDPHEDRDNFIRYTRYSATGTGDPISLGGNMCASCHKTAVDGALDSTGKTMNNHPTKAVTVPSTPRDFAFKPVNALADFEGTRLFDANGDPTGTNAGLVNCETCHSPHGAVKEYKHVEATRAVADASAPTGYKEVKVPDHLIGINTMKTADATLCINCHK
jgi:hypothetical protein